VKKVCLLVNFAHFTVHGKNTELQLPIQTVGAVKNHGNIFFILYCTCEWASVTASLSPHWETIVNSKGRKPVQKPGTQWLDVGRRAKT
jgi:hypothetical protein